MIDPRPGHGGFVETETPGFDGKEEHFAEEASDGHSRRTLVKLAALMHDVSKPATKTVEDSGRIRFIGHHTEGAAVVEGVLKRLRLSRRGIELVALMVRHHLRPSQMAQPGEMPSGKAVYRFFRDVGDASVDTLFLNLADYLAARGPDLGRDEWSQHCRLIQHILREGLEHKAPEVLPKLVTGHDIIDELRLDPGPMVGSLLQEVTDAVASGQISTKEEALELVRAKIEMRDARA
jgi:poly(A) polymerase